jgi:branched-subunit amino acid transport protein
VTALTVILAIAAGTYAMRLSMFALMSSRPVPERVDRALRLVGPAAVAALVATMAFSSGGSHSSRPPAELIAIAAAVLVVRRTGNVTHAFAVGLPAMWVLTPLLG